MDGSGDGERRRKKRSRWEESEQPSNAIVVAAPPGLGMSQFTFPKEVKLSNGIVVSGSESASARAPRRSSAAAGRRLGRCRGLGGPRTVTANDSSPGAHEAGCQEPCAQQELQASRRSFLQAACGVS